MFISQILQVHWLKLGWWKLHIGFILVFNSLSEPIPQQEYKTNSNHRSDNNCVTSFPEVNFLHQIIDQWKSVGDIV